MGYIEETGIAQILRDARILPIYEGTNGIQAMDLVGRKIISDNGLGMNELILEMHECANKESLSEQVSIAQLNRFTESLSALENATSLVLNNSEKKQHSGQIAFDFLMMAGTITATWQMLKSLDKAKIAFESNTVSSDFFEEKSKSVKHFLDFILPRYLSNFATISALSN